MSLSMSKWKEFKFGDLISNIHKAKAINKDDLTVATDSDKAIRYITRTGENNGCELLADINDIDKVLIERVMPFQSEIQQLLAFIKKKIS